MKILFNTSKEYNVQKTVQVKNFWFEIKVYLEFSVVVCMWLCIKDRSTRYYYTFDVILLNKLTFEKKRETKENF